jgi:hypothetical protein
MVLKKFILKFLLFVLAFIGIYLFSVNKLSKGYVDSYYNKFTQEAGSLIIGISRANQAISPSIIEKEMVNINIDKPIVNFAVNSYQSPYGEVYFNAIKAKLKKKSNQGLFILSVTPGNFTAQSLEKEDILKIDKKTMIGKISHYSSSPNYDYIINNYSEPLYNLFYPLNWKHQISHTDGWNEVKLEYGQQKISDNDILAWKAQTLKKNEKRAKSDTISIYRINSFISLIKYLKNKGNVFIVRLPSDIDIINLENEKWSSFNLEMSNIAKTNNVPFLNYTQQLNEYKTYDGSHLESESAKKFTKVLSDDIKSFLLKK